MPYEKITTLLKTLRFNGMLSQLPEIMVAAQIKQINGIALMQQFLETEVAYRQTRSLSYRLEVAKLPQIKSLDTFDCNDTPVQQHDLNQLEQCQFVMDKSNVLLIGGTGSGKTHIALAIAYAALQKLHRVKFYLFADLARHLLKAKEHRYEANLMARLQRFELLIIDDMGYLPIDQQAGSLLFELFAKLYEKTSVIIATHLTFDEWEPLFGGSKASKVIVDRITHHCKIIETGNISWRLKEGCMTKN